MGNGSADRLPRDWAGWHKAYDNPTSGLSWRLRLIQRWIRGSLDILPPGPVRVISVCAGQGRDLIGALTDHPRRHDVTARLVELDPRNTDIARRLVSKAALSGLNVVTGDASTTTAYAGAVPAQLILVCGVFGNITDEDVGATIAALPSLAAPGATVIWTRHTQAPDLTGQIRAWFGEAGFDERAFDALPHSVQSVGVHCLNRPPEPYEPGKQLFNFVGYDQLHGTTDLWPLKPTDDD